MKKTRKNRCSSTPHSHQSIKSLHNLV